MSQIHYVIGFGKQKSGEKPYGQKDYYPLAHATLALGERMYTGFGDRKGETRIETSFFATLDPNHTEFDQDMLQNLDHYLLSLVTNKMDPDTVTLLEVTTSDDSASYKINRKVEHPNAVIGKHGDHYIVISDEATISTIEKAGDQATFQTKVDFKNRQVNGK